MSQRRLLAAAASRTMTVQGLLIRLLEEQGVFRSVTGCSGRLRISQIQGHRFL